MLAHKFLTVGTSNGPVQSHRDRRHGPSGPGVRQGQTVSGNRQGPSGQGSAQSNHGSRPASQRGQNARHYHNPNAVMQQYDRVIRPALAVMHRGIDQCKIVQRAGSTEVIMPVYIGYSIMLAQALIVVHKDGDVSVLQVVVPDGLSLIGGMGGAGVAVELRNNLKPGEHYERLALYNSFSGVACQRYGFRELNERVGSLNTRLPDIRIASPSVLDKLSRFTGLSVQLNQQIKSKNYARVYDKHSLQQWNNADLAKMDQDIREMSSIVYGTELEVCRQILAMGLASVGDPNIDLSSACLGQAADVDVERVSPERIAAQLAGHVEVEVSAPEPITQVAVEEVVHA